MSARLLRISSLILPVGLAGLLAVRVDREPILHTVAPVLVMLWIFMIGTLVMRFIEGREHRGPSSTSHWEHIDVLTAGGAALSWLASGALIGARLTGWASLSVIGVLGFGLVFATVAWTTIMAGGLDRWRKAVISREILPEVAAEGDELREELRLTNVEIPIGMRLFVTGQPMRHGPVTRYAIGAESSKAELRLESALGPARRGEHHAPPLALWLGDVLGLSRTPTVLRAEARFTILPRPGVVDGAQRLLDLGGDDALARPAHKLPTEGTFRIRAYVAGDDTRRIHWVRSSQQDELIVRLPDEVPPAAPFVRVVLDNELFGTETLTTRAPDDLLDALVRVWLGVGRSLSESGTRVTLVTALAHDGTMRSVERKLRARSSRDDQRLGARVTWQATVPLDALVGRGNVRQIVISSRPRRVDAAADLVWVVVPELAWTSCEDLVRTDSGLTHMFPSGSAENRGGRRRREQRRLERQWHDRNVFSQVACWADWRSYSGHHVARPVAGRADEGGRDEGRIALAVIP